MSELNEKPPYESIFLTRENIGYSWCEDDIDGDGLEYVHISKYAEQVAEAERLREEIKEVYEWKYKQLLKQTD